jgi:hypothetical protein
MLYFLSIFTYSADGAVNSYVNFQLNNALYIYIYIYIYMCVCVCVCESDKIVALDSENGVTTFPAMRTSDIM